MNECEIGNAKSCTPSLGYCRLFEDPVDLGVDLVVLESFLRGCAGRTGRHARTAAFAELFDDHGDFLLLVELDGRVRARGDTRLTGAASLLFDKRSDRLPDERCGRR